MALETAFRIANLVALLGWVVLIASATLGWAAAWDRVAGTAVPLLLAGAYVVLLAGQGGVALGDFNSLPGVQALFREPAAALAGWIHYLAFDLLVGSMLTRRMMDQGMLRILRLVVLPLTFLFGPAGFLLYHVLARFHGGAAGPAGNRGRRC